MNEFDSGNFHMNIRPGYGPGLFVTANPIGDGGLAERQVNNKLRRDSHKRVWPKTLTANARQRVKLARKYSLWNTYTGTVNNHAIQATGRTKREAVKRLRVLFAHAGIRTQPTPFLDLLEVSHRYVDLPFEG